MKIKESKTTVYALFISVTILMAQISIPLPFTPIPVNLTIIAVLLSGAVLGAKEGAMCQAVYIIMGIAGLPVFVGFHGGIFSIIGPTGGYIIGYIFAAFLVGLIVKRYGCKFTVCLVAMILGLLLIYMFGTMWFMVYAKTSFLKALAVCVIPFLAIDVLKVIVSASIAKRLKDVNTKINR